MLNKKIAIYQSKDGGLEIIADLKNETIWLTQADLSLIFEKDQSVISRHLKNIFRDGEIDKKSNMQKMHIANSDKPVEFYSLDIVLAVGYRTNSQKAMEFRKWATKTLREHIVKGYTINKRRIAKNYEEFLHAVESVQKLLPEGNKLKAQDALELVKMFAGTWLSLDAYDKSTLPKSGANKKQVRINADELVQALATLKENLLKKKEATKLFGQENQKDAVAGILGNIFHRGGMLTKLWKKKRPICFTFLSKIIRLWMTINGAVRLLLFGFSINQESYIKIKCLPKH